MFINDDVLTYICTYVDVRFFYVYNKLNIFNI